MKFVYKKRAQRTEALLSKRRKICYHVISIFIILTLIIIVPLFGMDVLKRTVAAFTDLGTSFKYYFVEYMCLFTGEDNWVFPTIIEIPESAVSLLPWDIEEFKTLFKVFLNKLISQDNLLSFIGAASGAFVNFIKILMPLSLIIMLLVIVNLMTGSKVTKNKGDSRPLQCWYNFSKKVVKPTVKFISDYINFLLIGKRKIYIGITAIILAVALNIATVLIEALAYIIYFCISLDFSSIYIQFAKLLFDLTYTLNVLPSIVSLFIGIYIFDIIRQKMGKAKLKKLEKSNVEFLDTLSTSILISGTMQAGKTMMLSYILILYQKIMKELSLKGLYRNAMRFPDFPYINLENKIKDLIKNHKIYEKYHCRRMIEVNRMYLQYSGDESEAGKKLARWYMKLEGVGEDEFDFIDENFFGYQFGKKVYRNGLGGIDIFQALTYYAEYYYIYSLQTPEIISNFSLEWNFRCDNDGNFPLWDLDIIRSQHVKEKGERRFSKILNQDMLRLGKTMHPEDESRHALEFGGIGINEIDKERGNQFVTRGLKRDADECNQINDDFPLHERIKRHGATVEYDNFIITVGDLQRVDDLGANHTGISDELHVRSSKFNIELPFFHFEQLLNDIFLKYHMDTYFNDRYYHSNDTLTRHFLSFLFSKFFNFMERRKNLFGVRWQKIDVHAQGANENDKCSKVKFPIIASVVYGVYRTDAYNGIFEEKLKHSNTGLLDMREYANDAASWDELRFQNSYLVKRLDEAFMNIESSGNAKHKSSYDLPDVN